MKVLISHLYRNKENDKWVIQTNEEHSIGVAERASCFASEFNMSSYGRALGLLHDKGKESDAFQQHIRRDSGCAPDTRVVGNSNHAYIGGIIARNIYGRSLDNILVNQIVSHHSGLHDTGDLENILNAKIPLGVNAHVDKVRLDQFPGDLARCDFHHVARMLYSCLVDADYLDTEAFMDKDSSALRLNKASLPMLLPILEKYLDVLKSGAKDTEVNTVRNQVQTQCLKMAEMAKGFYSLTVPTGGGKTLSSLLWAMKHAVHNGQKRIIIAIPYTSIIMQTASIFRGIFGDENVLEHHSNIDLEGIKDSAMRERMKLATENWDYPIIVTTNVQLFESIFSNKPSKCRKLHNIVNSVVILDEVQTLPMDYLQPIVESLKTYRKVFGVSVLFTTASQPVLKGRIEGCNPKASFDGIENVTEIIPEDFKLQDKLRRVKLEIDDRGKTYEEVAAMLCKHKKVLCIVNTRKDAKDIYERMPQEGITLHLSKNMCPVHITETIEHLKTALKEEKNETIRVVSTQLIEAGVDIDFPVVYRQEAGLDSVLQAAGRCNREGKNGRCTTYVFSLAQEHNLPKEMRSANEARKSLVGTYDWFAPSTMTSYFKQLYCRRATFDKKDMKHYLYNVKDLCFATAAKEFQLIEDAGRNVIVCWKDSMDLVGELVQKGPSYILMKKLSKYIVNVHQTDFDALREIGVVSEKIKGIYVIDYKEQYDEHIGLRTDNNWTNTSLII